MFIETTLEHLLPKSLSRETISRIAGLRSRIPAMLRSSRKRRSHATDRVNVPVYYRKNNKLEHDIQTSSTTCSSNTKHEQRYSGSFVECLSGPRSAWKNVITVLGKNEGRREGFERVIVPGNSLTIKSDAAVEFRH